MEEKKQPEALRLADLLEKDPNVNRPAIATELRRLRAETVNQRDWLVEWRKCAEELKSLRAVNAQMLEALQWVVAVYDKGTVGYLVGAAFDKARAAIAAAQGEGS